MNGDKGTLYFECHYVDVKTGKLATVVGADQDVQKIDGKWLITTLVGNTGSSRLSPTDGAPTRSGALRASAADALDRRQPAGQSRRRLPVKVRTKLLVAFAGSPPCSSPSPCSAYGCSAQSNTRVVSLGTLQLRAATYQSLQTQAQQLRQLLALRVGQDPNLNTYVGGRYPPSIPQRPQLDTRRPQRRRVFGKDDSWSQIHKLDGGRSQSFCIAAGPAEVDADVSAVHPSQLLKFLSEHLDPDIATAALGPLLLFC